ncbi:MAG: BREX system P-loop protein BrxC [Rubrobacter sp.]|nr:BREX system P-loop protein BrxC [Rubrobacter sp.]
MQIRELLTRDLSRKIEEIVQLNQVEQETVYEEISEYVATDSIKRQYRDLLEAINESRTQPTGGVGVWISGFFGSGKSSFAKNLGYVLTNEEVLGRRAVDLFNESVDDDSIADLIDVINLNMPTEVVMFDVQKDKSQAGHGSLSISPFVYRVLLRHLGYAEDFDLAELEISLEAEGRLDEFVEIFDRRYASEHPNRGWMGTGRKSALVWDRVGVVLNELDPETYPTEASFTQSLVQNRVGVSPKLVVDRAFELMKRRRPGKALVFIIDEVGQYVAYSQERLEDLRALVELFGAEGSKHLRAGEVPAQAWFIVTAQERIEDVVSAIGDEKRVLIAKVQDRFPHRVDLSPADVSEVASRRVLYKNDRGQQELSELFAANEGRLNASCKLQSRSRKSEVDEKGFVDFYPYLPHYIDLSISIMAGIRLQPGATKHVGGSNRTIISQVYEMLVNPRTDFADKPVGALVSLDALYELIEGQVGSSKGRDVAEVSARFANDPEDGGWAARVAKVIALLEFVSDLPRTPANIAAMLVDRVDRSAPLPEVEAALKRLVEAQFVRETGEGYKLQTAQEKSWEQEKEQYKQLKPKDRNEIKREILTDVFGETNLKRYLYKGLRTFSVGVSMDGASVASGGQVPLSVLVAEGEGDLASRVTEAVGESRQNLDDVYWVFALNPEIDRLVAEYYASGRMISTYEQLQSRDGVSNETATSLTAERNERRRLRGTLSSKFEEAIAGGQGVFRGVSKDASDLGLSTADIFRGLFDFAVPDLYPKLEMGSPKLGGKEAEEVLRASNLQGLSPVFYDGDEGLGLVVPEGARYVPNPSAEISKEVLDYLKGEHAYGNKVTGKILEERFGGMPYGWDRDVLKMVLAVLLRAGSIEVTYQGRRFRNHLDPQCRTPFATTPAFRAASFAPREAIDLKTLINAVKQYEGLTGDEVDVEEGALSAAFKKLAEEEMGLLLPVISDARANRLPVLDALEDYRNTLQIIRDAASDDAVRILSGEGSSFREAREKAGRIRAAVEPDNLERLRQTRAVHLEMWPVLKPRAEGVPLAEKALELEILLDSDEFYERLPRIEELSREISGAYRSRYLELHALRRDSYDEAVTALRDLKDWDDLEEAARSAILAPLVLRACREADLPEGSARCRRCGATIAQMDSDLAATDDLARKAYEQLQEAIAPEVPVERVRVSAFFDGALDSPESVDAAVDRLREHLLKLVAEGARIVLE